MSATVASAMILTLALLGGFVWWERSRPPSRLLALVATVAALAVVGRIAFAAIPNVKPTTDIVLFAGFALGAAPGFAVGATAAVASNIFFGQGPWTPWQMAAWGLVGLLGAGLARVAPRAGRLPLAITCGLAGLLFGELLNTQLWIYYSDHSTAAWLVYAGRGIPFDAAHVIGNVLFCLAFGPAFIAALRRFETRLHVIWVPLAMLLLLAPLAVAAPTSKPVAYLDRAQNADGGFGSQPHEASSPLYSGWAALGLEATGRRPTKLLAYIKHHQPTDPGSLARSILALAPAGETTHTLVAKLQTTRGAHGAYAGRVNTTAFALLALEAAGVKPRRASVRWLAGQQNADGGFNFAGRGGASGIDDTSAPLQALVAAHGSKTAVRRAASFLASHENADGGYPLSPGSSSNAQSTAWAVQGLVAAGKDPAKALAYLRGLTEPGGAVRYSRTSAQTPVWVTAQALDAFARAPFPLARLNRPKRTTPMDPITRIVVAVTAVLVRFRAA